jgi:hypothetical protein
MYLIWGIQICQPRKRQKGGDNGTKQTLAVSFAMASSLAQLAVYLYCSFVITTTYLTVYFRPCAKKKRDSYQNRIADSFRLKIESWPAGLVVLKEVPTVSAPSPT